MEFQDVTAVLCIGEMFGWDVHDDMA